MFVWSPALSAGVCASCHPFIRASSCADGDRVGFASLLVNILSCCSLPLLLALRTVLRVFVLLSHTPPRPRASWVMSLPSSEFCVARSNNEREKVREASAKLFDLIHFAGNVDADEDVLKTARSLLLQGAEANGRMGFRGPPAAAPPAPPAPPASRVRHFGLTACPGPRWRRRSRSSHRIFRTPRERLPRDVPYWDGRQWVYG